jgi:Yip1 domain
MTSKFGLNPWVTIWTQPRKTIRVIVENDPKYHFFYLASIYGLQTLLFLMYSFRMFNKENIITILITSIVLSPILGAIFIYYNAWVLHFSGKWLKGKAPFINIRAALSWSKVPNVIPILMWFILLTFSSEIITSPSQSATTLFIDLISLISGVWILVILIKSVEEVQNFSTWRSIGNIIIAFIISFVLIYILNIALNFVIKFFRS